MLLTPAEAAAILGLSKWQILENIKRGNIPALKTGPRTFRIDPAELEAFRKRCTMGTPTVPAKPFV